MKFLIPLMLMIGFLLQGCLGKQNPIKEDVIFLQSIPSCNSPEVCDAMWNAAGAWVDKYSPQGVDTFADDLIHSEAPELGSDEMEIVVKKIKQKDGSYKILIDNICVHSFGNCITERKNMIAFNKKMISFLPEKEKVVKEEKAVKLKKVKKRKPVPRPKPKPLIILIIAAIILA
ncbi:MAG: hypothetical protein KAU21_11665, partial [Gammaproteobacteria bacterium]|nr:hypothetical protein [Gammaproteobacteria bacterium]